MLVAVALVVLVAGVLTYVVLSGSSSSSSSSPTGTPFGCTTTCGASGGLSGTTNLTAGNWTTYHGSVSRGGFLPTGNVTSVHPKWAGPLGLDGEVYGEPLTCGDAIFVATEDDSVYAVNATNGHVLWRTNLGTPVPGRPSRAGTSTRAGSRGLRSSMRPQAPSTRSPFSIPASTFCSE